MTMCLMMLEQENADAGLGHVEQEGQDEPDAQDGGLDVGRAKHVFQDLPLQQLPQVACKIFFLNL